MGHAGGGVQQAAGYGGLELVGKAEPEMYLFRLIDLFIIIDL